MSGPIPELMVQYGTDVFYLSQLEKRAGLEGVLKAVAPLIFAGAMVSDKKHQDEQQLEAHMMTEAFRQLEAERMAPVAAGFMGGGYRGQNKEGMIRLASAAGSVLAKQAMAKEAIGLGMFQALGTSIKGLVGAVGKAGGSALTSGRSLARAGAMGAGLQAAKAPAMQGILARGAQAVGGKVKGLGEVAQQGAQRLETGVANLGARAPKAPIAAGPAVPKMPGAAAAPNPVAGTAAGVVPPATGPATPKKPLIGWKGKAAIGAGLAGAGYAGYKGLQTAKDYMMQSTQPAAYWGGQGMAPASSVNQYGYAQQS